MPSHYAASHVSPQGPGDARPTAMQIIQDEDLVGKFTGKVALITGISSGIGLETALALKAAGIHVYGAVRNVTKATTALQQHLEPGHLDLLEFDLSSLASVRACAADFLSKSTRLDIIITNAGIMMTPESTTIDGYESQFATNHLAHFLLFNLLKDTMLSSSTPEHNSRVVVLTSVAHRTGSINFSNINLTNEYDPVKAYDQSKLANLYTSNTINRLYSSQGLTSNAVMPGGIMSGLQSSLPPSLLESWKGDSEFMKAWKSTEQGAATSVWAAVGKELEGRGGLYLEDCGVAERAVEGAHMGLPGYGWNAFDEKAEDRLWEVSLEMVG